MVLRGQAGRLTERPQVWRNRGEQGSPFMCLALACLYASVCMSTQETPGRIAAITLVCASSTAL